LGQGEAAFLHGYTEGREKMDGRKERKTGMLLMRWLRETIDERWTQAAVLFCTRCGGVRMADSSVVVVLEMTR
jgi:hypothetical protein